MLSHAITEAFRVPGLSALQKRCFCDIQEKGTTLLPLLGHGGYSAFTLLEMGEQHGSKCPTGQRACHGKYPVLLLVHSSRTGALSSNNGAVFILPKETCQ